MLFTTLVKDTLKLSGQNSTSKIGNISTNVLNSISVYHYFVARYDTSVDRHRVSGSVMLEELASLLI